ncbi:MAG: hypothetical protein ABSG61_02345 [Gemmatimonadales bacterium]|jgi:hypothetical protein
MKIMSAVVGTLTLVALAACSESKLVVVDLNQPDQGRALQSAGDVENLLTSQFRVLWNNTQGTNVSLEMQLECLGMESSTGLGNAESGKYCGVPRTPVDNSINNPSALNKYNPYLGLYRAARSAAIAINQMSQPGFTFIPADAKEYARDVAFGYFEIGVALGDVALVYDSGSVVAPGDNLSSAAPPYVSAATLMTSALADLDSALAYGAQNPSVGTNGWPAPSSWINGWDGSQATFIKLVHSWKARLRAGVARTPAERAAVTWTAVIADAQAGITSDFIVTMTTAAPNWAYDPSEINQGTTWSQMWQWMVGMADTSGNYTTYLSNIVNNGVFLVVTPDKRFPAGTTRAAQNAASAGFSPNNGYPYIQNHVVAQDVTVSPEQTSQYNFWRFQQEIAASASNGPVAVMTVGEMNGLMAEGYLRAGNYAAAMTAINATRVPAGLPALTGIADTTTRVPGGNACVPKVPDPATSYKSAKCGNIWEAMKWEKRLEEAYTSWGAWWIDGRGWGDLPIGSALEYPTPYQELQTRNMTIYSTTRLAAKGNYGL